MKAIYQSPSIARNYYRVPRAQRAPLADACTARETADLQGSYQVLVDSPERAYS